MRDTNPDVELAVLDALLNANAEPFSLTGLTLIVESECTESLTAIIQRLCLSKLIAIRQVSDSISGDGVMYYIGRNQQKKAKERLAQLRLNQKEPLPKAIDGVRANESILLHLLNNKKKQTAEHIHQACKINKLELTWRLQSLLRNERISSQIKHGQERVYFLTDEQSSRAMLAHNPEQAEQAIYSQDHLHEAINESIKNLKDSRSQLSELAEHLHQAQTEIDQVQSDIDLYQAMIDERSKLLKELRVTEQRLANSVGAGIAYVQADPVKTSARLSFLRELVTRPAFTHSALIKEILNDYELALELTRSDALPKLIGKPSKQATNKRQSTRC